MPFVEKRLISPTSLTTSAATALYTVPTGYTAIVKQIVVTNTTGTAATFTMYIGAASAGNALFSGTSVAANDTVIINLSQVLGTDEILRALSGTNAALNLTVSGVENDGPLAQNAMYIADNAITSAKIAPSPTFTGTVTSSSGIIQGTTTTDLLRITQLGTGNALLVEDSTNPDSTPFVVSASGSVGVGVTSPLASLHILAGTATGVSPGAGGRMFIDGNNANMWIDIAGSTTSEVGLRFGDSGAILRGQVRYSNTSDSLDFSTAGSERMRIDSSGFVGIGVAAPTVRLDVSGSTTIGTQNNVAAAFGVGTSGRLLAGSITGNTPFIGSEGATSFIFTTNGIERMRINADGTIGFTGVPSAPTANAGTNTTQLATTAFVTTADNLKANIASPTFTGNVTISSGNLITASRPSFYAVHAASNNLGSGTQVFTNVQSNIGSCYNSSNGRFTATIAGQYQFQGKLLSIASGTLSCELRKNDAYVQYAENSRAGSNYIEVTFVAVITLAVGDYMTIYSPVNVYGYAYSNFSGFFIG